MAKSEIISGINNADAALAAWADTGNRYPSVSIDAKNRIEMYGGNNADRNACREFIQSFAAKSAAPAETVGAPATAKQITYIKALAHRDPAAALSCNVQTIDLDALTKNAASALITSIKAYS